MTDRPRTLRDLKESGYRSTPVKSEMRRNLLVRLRRKEEIFPGILGYDETVVPQIQNAILSMHDMLFLGLRGQGKGFVQPGRGTGVTEHPLSQG